MKKIIIDNPSDANQRLDKFVKKFLPNAPLGAIYKMLRTGKIKVSDKKQLQTYRVNLGDEISFFFSEEEILRFQEKSQDCIVIKSTQNRHKIDTMSTWKRRKKLDIIYQDDDILIVNKDAWLNVHPGDHKTKEVSLIEMVHDYLWKKYQSLTFKPSLVHRIDRDTSGCIIIALKKDILENLLSQLQNHKIEKIYHALVVGKMQKPRATITDKLLRKENTKDEAKVIVSEKWQKAITHYQTLKQFLYNDIDFSLLECSIETWRTHQIRVHLSHNNCPILWDKAYGDKKINSYVGRNLQIQRQLLHAYSLEFTHPKKNKKMKVVAPYKKDMKNFLVLNNYEIN